MNRKKINKKSNKVAKWIVDTILELDDKNLINFYELIESELINRGLVYKENIFKEMI